MIEPAPPQPVRDQVDTAARFLEILSRVAVLGVILGLVGGVTTLLVPSRGDGSPGMVAFMACACAVVALVWAATLGGFAALLRVNADQAAAVGRLDRRLAEALGQFGATLEALKTAAPAEPVHDRKAEHLAEIRHAIRAGHWDEASALVGAFADTHPDDPAATRLADELAESRSAAGRELLAKIEAARAVNEPERVIELRDGLKPLIDPAALRTLDRDLAKWLMVSIHRRLRSGTVGPDVAGLAARVAGSLEETPEGASLRASLPTLRRAAGLCARCGQPYRGIADACPACLSGSHTTPAGTPRTATSHPSPETVED